MSVSLWAVSVLSLLGALVLVHELGHFFTAKVLGIRVLRLSVGFGPRLAGFAFGGTEYRLSLIPLGGYVRLLGEDPDRPLTDAEKPRAFSTRPLWQRYLVVVAGPAFNLLLPLGIFLFHELGQRALPGPIIGTVIEGLPAADAGLRPGDRVRAIDGQPIRYWRDLEATVLPALGQTLRFEIARDDRIEERDVTPQILERGGTFRARERIGWIGVSPRFRLPELGALDPRSPAAAAGLRAFDLLVAVNGAPVESWPAVEREIARSGAAPVRIAFLRGGRSALDFVDLTPLAPGSAVIVPLPIPTTNGRHRYETGLQPASMVVHAVEPDSPAAAIGLKAGDQILTLDGEPMVSWELLVQRLAERPGRPRRLGWRTPGMAAREATFTPELRSSLDAYRQLEERLLFGASTRFAWRAPTLVPVENRLPVAVGRAVRRTARTVADMTAGLEDVVLGDAPASALGGPLMIGYVAGVAAEQGLAQYLALLALLSINVALLNFLPIPLLDGGQLMFFGIELALGRPPSSRVRRAATSIGLAVVALLLAVAIRNDVVRLFLT